MERRSGLVQKWLSTGELTAKTRITIDDLFRYRKTEGDYPDGQGGKNRGGEKETNQKL